MFTTARNLSTFSHLYYSTIQTRVLKLVFVDQVSPRKFCVHISSMFLPPIVLHAPEILPSKNKLFGNKAIMFSVWLQADFHKMASGEADTKRTRITAMKDRTFFENLSDYWLLKYV
jgi:hypothetical protein